MLRCATREPTPPCRFEQEAREPSLRCACGCGAEVSNPGEYYSDECQEAAERAAAAEARADRARDEEA